jgi:alpha-L-fucosidase
MTLSTNARRMRRIAAAAWIACTFAVSSPAQTAPFEPTWESLKRYQAPAWFQDAKFGIFLHWGVYSVPAFGSEKYPQRMYLKNRTPGGKPTEVEDPVYKHHVERWGPQSKFGYKDFIPMFKAEKWNPEEWAELFQQSGARYVVPVAEHHDGFAMYNSSQTEWNAVKMGPHRDVLGELEQAVRKHGMKFGASSHYALNRTYYNCTDDFDTCDPRYRGLYGEERPRTEPASPAFLKHWYARTVEIVDKYHPDLLWFDFCINFPEFQPYLQRLGAHYYNQGSRAGDGVVLQYKDIGNGSFPEGTAVLDIERGKLREIRKMVWQTDTSVSTKSWGYIDDDEFKSPDSLVDDLVDIVSKNGCLLLNVGPKADGTIPVEARNILLAIGGWLQRNGEAIYGSRPWRVFGEGPTQPPDGHMGERKRGTHFTASDIRFTTKAGAVYAIVLDWPAGQLKIASLSSKAETRKIAAIHLLGMPDPLQWKQDETALVVQLPSKPVGDYAHAFKVEFR